MNFYFFLLFYFFTFFSQSQIAYSQPNTANLNYSVKFLSDYGHQYLNLESLKDLYPEDIRIASLDNLINKQNETIILIYQASSEKNKIYISQFLDIWFQLHKSCNFILIDRDKEANYYANLFIGEYWKGEDFKLIYMENSGKVKFESAEFSSLNGLKKALLQKYKNKKY